ncbi:MAG: RNA polymerase sigma factor, partial [Nannocystaceae bacterium]
MENLSLEREQEQRLIRAAIEGDRQAFDQLLRPNLHPLRSFLFRMVAHPEDAEDLAQDTVIKAHRGLAKFRGDSAFRTWLFSIGTRAALDLLRTRRRWPIDAQTEGEKVSLASTPMMQSIDEIVRSDDFCFEYRQHVAYCFSCVARSLPPEESAALLLREVYLFDGRGAAKVL